MINWIVLDRYQLPGTLNQATHRACRGRELLGFHAEVLQHREIEVWQRVIVGAAEGEVLTVFITPTTEEHRHVAIVVRRGVSEIGRQNYHGVINQVRALELAEKIAPAIDSGLLDDGKLFELLTALTVVGKRVVGFVDAFEGSHRVAGTVKRDKAGRVGLESHEDGIEEGAHNVGRVVTIRTGGSLADLGFWLVDQVFVGLKAQLQLTHRREPFIELLAVPRADLTLERFGLRTNNVHDRFSAAGDITLPLLGVRGIIDKKSRKKFAGVVDSRNHSSAF